MGRAIGIDLGTTNSCAAVIENNQPTIIMYRGGSYTIPSLFAVDDQGKTFVGEEARERATLDPKGTVYAPKRLVGRSFQSPQLDKIRRLFTYDMVEGSDGEVLITVKDQTFDLKEVSAHILRKIKEVAENYLGDEVVNAVITVPAYFNDKQRQAVRQAGKMADLTVLRVLNEPTAAALAYGLGKNLRQRLAVYDLGGGTFDISIIEVRDKVFEVVATGGDTLLGGIDFDDLIMGWIMEDFRKETGIDLSDDLVALQRLRECAERAKITLSSTNETKIEVPFIAKGPKNILSLETSLSRDQLEGLLGDLVTRTISTCEKIFTDAKLGPADIDEVLLVGGQSRMPLVQDKVRQYFGREPCKGVHPDEAVAVGASIMAHSLTHALGEKVTLLDVLPMPIGIAKVDKSFLPLFPQNCPIPHVRRLTLTNSKDGQKTIMLRVYQGTQKMAADNELLGTFVFAGLRVMPRGQVKVEVWLSVDSEGILSISAKDKDTGEAIQVRLKRADKSFAPAIALTTESQGSEGAAAVASAAAQKAEKQAEKPSPPPPPRAPAARSERSADDAAASDKEEEDTDRQDATPGPSSDERIPAKTEEAKPPAAQEELGCLTMLLPWNWFR